MTPNIEVIISVFQSTLPVGGATLPFRVVSLIWNISIHAPRGGSDDVAICIVICHWLFQSTLPVGGATYYFFVPNRLVWISIHAPRGGSDSPTAYKSKSAGISIHAPRGGSDYNQVRGAPTHFTFQSTLPVGGATTSQPFIITLKLFQSTLPVGGATAESAGHTRRLNNFNPRSPWGERLFKVIKPAAETDFNPRSPWGERLFVRTANRTRPLFQSTLPVGGATRCSGFRMSP